MSRIAQSALAAAAIVAAGSALLPAAYLEFYQEQNSGTCAHRRFLDKIVYRFGQTRDIWWLIEGRTGFASIGDNVESAPPALIANSMTVAAVSGEPPTADQVIK